MVWSFLHLFALATLFLFKQVLTKYVNVKADNSSIKCLTWARINRYYNEMPVEYLSIYLSKLKHEVILHHYYYSICTCSYAAVGEGHSPFTSTI